MKETTFDEQSSLKIYSLGIVIKSEDAPASGRIMVSPVESMNIQAPGVIGDNHNEFKASHPNEKGQSTPGTLTAENYVKAKWMSLGASNRVTPPTVHPNETVLLFRYGNDDTFYWTTLFHEPDLRKKESAAFAFSNLSTAKGWGGDGKAVKFDKSTSYWFEVDTTKKIASFTTPKNDGEAASFSITVDAGKGSLTLQDDKGNSITIDSNSGITVTSKTNVQVTAAGSISLAAAQSSSTGPFSVGGSLSVAGSISGGGDIHVGTVYCSNVVTGAGGGGVVSSPAAGGTPAGSVTGGGNGGGGSASAGSSETVATPVTASASTGPGAGSNESASPQKARQEQGEVASVPKAPVAPVPPRKPEEVISSYRKPMGDFRQTPPQAALESTGRTLQALAKDNLPPESYRELESVAALIPPAKIEVVEDAVHEFTRTVPL